MLAFIHTVILEALGADSASVRAMQGRWTFWLGRPQAAAQ